MPSVDSVSSITPAGLVAEAVGGGFHQPSSHRRAPPEAQTPEESAAVRPEGHCLLLEKMTPSFGARKERELFWKPSAPVPEFLPEYVSRLTSFCQISV